VAKSQSKINYHAWLKKDPKYDCMGNDELLNRGKNMLTKESLVV
jgi:hypothetical protein